MTDKIFKYARSGDVNGLNKELNNKNDINSQDMDGNTPLILSTKEGHLESVKTIVFKKAKLDLQSNNGDTALSWAIIKGFTDIAFLLITKGAKLNVLDAEGKTPLSWAVSNGYTHLVQVMIKHGANINSRDNEGNTPLMKAAKKGYNDIAQILIDNDANLNIQNQEGVCALQLASLEWNVNIALSMIQKGANINTTDKHGCTAIENLLKMRSVDVIKNVVNSALSSPFARDRVIDLYTIFSHHINNDFTPKCFLILEKKCAEFKSNNKVFNKLNTVLSDPKNAAKILSASEYREGFFDSLIQIEQQCDLDLLYKVCVLKQQISVQDNYKPNFFKEVFVDEINNFFHDLSSVWGNAITEKDIEALMYDLKQLLQSLQLENLQKDNEQLKLQINSSKSKNTKTKNNKDGEIGTLNDANMKNSVPKSKYGRKSILDMLYAAKHHKLSDATDH